MHTPKLNALLAVVLTAAALAAVSPTVPACGGEYPAAVSAGTGQGVAYCSDGTFGGLGVPPTGAADVRCGEEYPVAVEADSGQGLAYCSDGTINGVLALLP